MGLTISYFVFNLKTSSNNMAETEEENIDEPNSSKTITNINDIMDNPGFSHIIEKILLPLDHNTCFSGRLVCKSWKKHFDNPYIWIKKLNQKGQPTDLQNAWIDLLQRIEKGSLIEWKFTKCLMIFGWHMYGHKRRR